MPFTLWPAAAVASVLSIAWVPAVWGNGVGVSTVGQSNGDSAGPDVAGQLESRHYRAATPRESHFQTMAPTLQAPRRADASSPNFSLISDQVLQQNESQLPGSSTQGSPPQHPTPTQANELALPGSPETSALQASSQHGATSSPNSSSISDQAFQQNESQHPGSSPHSFLHQHPTRAQANESALPSSPATPVLQASSKYGATSSPNSSSILDQVLQQSESQHPGSPPHGSLPEQPTRTTANELALPSSPETSALQASSQYGATSSPNSLSISDQVLQQNESQHPGPSPHGFLHQQPTRALANELALPSSPATPVLQASSQYVDISPPQGSSLSDQALQEWCQPQGASTQGLEILQEKLEPFKGQYPLFDDRKEDPEDQYKIVVKHNTQLISFMGTLRNIMVPPLSLQVINLCFDALDVLQKRINDVRGLGKWPTFKPFYDKLVKEGRLMQRWLDNLRYCFTKAIST